MKFKDRLKNFITRGLNHVVEGFGEPVGLPSRAIDPCPYGCKDALGNSKIFLGCHLPLKMIIPEDWESRRGGVGRPVRKAGRIPKSSKHYFSAKGKDAEELVHGLASETFFADWCYLNPKLPDGKEICDLLVIFGRTAMIVQVKNVDVDRKTGQLNEAYISKNHRQLLGAHRQFVKLKKRIRLTNPRRGEEEFDTGEIQKVHLVSLFAGPARKGMPMADGAKGEKIHVFSGDFFEVLLNELDTAKDIFGYLSERERLFDESHVICRENENGLLAGYITCGLSFDFLKQGGVNIIEKTVWKGFTKSRAYREKKEADKSSYIWDELIAGLHAGVAIGDSEVSYERLARVMASTSRNERRGLVNSHMRGLAEVFSLPSTHDTTVRYVNDRNNKVTYCFFFYDESEVARRNLEEMFEYACIAARYKFPNKTVVGIACCPKSKEETLGWRFKMFEQEVLDPDEAERVKRMAKAANIVDRGMKTYAERILPDFTDEG